MRQNIELISIPMREVQRGALGGFLGLALSGGSRERVTPCQGFERAERPSRVSGCVQAEFSEAGPLSRESKGAGPVAYWGIVAEMTSNP